LLKFTEPQTVAVQRGLPLAPPAGMSPKTWAAFLAWALKLRRRIPGLR
jgi:succinate-semialdehyde dehydrogenase/glutarate-semialdehyde dehydrogenase